MKLATIHFDGGGQSPGPVTAACTVELSDGSYVKAVRRFDKGTHNTAEWHALILGLRLALMHSERHVVVKGDSTLVVKQVNGEWKTKSPALRSLRTQARSCWSSSRAGASSGFRARRIGAPTNWGGPATSALDEKRRSLTNRNLDHRQSESLRFICGKVAALALAARGAERDTAWAMSEENVEVVRAQIDAYNRGDYDAALALLDEEVEWHVPEVAALDAPASGIVQGRARVAEQFARWLEAWETHAFQVTDALSQGDDVFIAGLQVGRGRHSGLDIRVPTFHVFTVRDQKIVAMRAFPERAEALEAAGLRE